jgi:hypothetical protein
MEVIGYLRITKASRYLGGWEETWHLLDRLCSTNLQLYNSLRLGKRIESLPRNAK